MIEVHPADVLRMFDRVHTVQASVRVALDELQLVERRDIEVPDTGVIQRVDDQRRRIGLDRIQHVPRKIIQEPACTAGRGVGPVTKNGLIRCCYFQVVADRLEVFHSWNLLVAAI